MRKPRRIVVTHPGSSLYGSDRMVLESVRGLLDAGLSPLVVVPEPGALVDLVGSWGVPVVVSPMAVLRKSALTAHGLVSLVVGAVPSLWRAVSLLRAARPDAVYVSTMTIPVWILAARLGRVPVVCHVHEAESAAPLLVQQALALPLRGAARVIINSRFAADGLTRSAPGLAGRSTVVLNGLDGPPAVVPPRPQLDGPVRLLYVGRLSERKGVLVALRATQLLLEGGLDVRLDLVGDVFVDHVEFAEALGRQLDQPALRGRVVRHGFHDDVWPFLAGCDVLLVPSVLPEPFGNTAVEGVLAARPVVASDVGGLPEALEGYVVPRLVAAGDPSALADGVRRVVAAHASLASDVLADAALAARRHDSARYREAVVAQIAAVAR